MPSVEVHCEISKIRTKGNDWRELHEWVDAPQKEKGIDHRKKRHAYNKRDEQYIKKYWDDKKGKGWGDKAIVEWLFHIAVDNLYTSYKKSYKVYGENTYNIFVFGINGIQNMSMIFGMHHNADDIVKKISDLFMGASSLK